MKYILSHLFSMLCIAISAQAQSNAFIRPPMNGLPAAPTFTAQADQGSHYYTSSFGLFDIQAYAGVNWTTPKKNLPKRDFGSDLDLSATFINHVYWKDSYAAFNASLHYGYSRQNFSLGGLSMLKFRRHDIYVRMKPFTNDITRPTDFSRIIGIFLSGVYVDLGYSQASYFTDNFSAGKNATQSIPSHFFWGWGVDIKLRQNRIGYTGGIGSKWYAFDMHDISRSYKAKTIRLGISYSLISNQ